MWCTKADDFRLQVYRTWKRPSKTHGKKSPLRQFENPLHNGKNDWMRLESSMEVLSPRLLAEPWRLEGWCERAGGNERAGMRVNAVCLQQFHQFIQLVRTCISTRRDQSSVRSYILLQCHRYTESPLCSLPETANRPDAAIACSLM